MFTINNLNKWRNQRLSVKVYLPVGQKIFIDPSVQRLLDDIDNVSNTYDGDMVNHTWQMQTQGLVCLDKIINEEDNEPSTNNDTEDVNMSISKDGVYVNGKRVDDDDKNEKNINIDAKEVHLKINENGVSAQVKGNKKKK